MNLQPATGIFTFTWALIALPLLGAFLILTFGKQLKKLAPYLGDDSGVGVSLTE